MKKQFLILFAFISVLAFSQVPQRFNRVIVTGDIVSPKFIKTGSTADSVLLGNGSARSVNSLKTDTVSLSNRINAKATGNGTANGTNTGDETLTSIKTKLGAASAVSDGYLTSNMFNVFNNSEPSFTKRTAFNKNFGTTTGTVLEGRTFGTAAGSAVGDFQPIENQRLSTTNSPSFNRLTSTVSTGIAPFTVNSTTMVGNLTSQYLGGNNYTSPDLNTLSSLGRFSVMQVMTTSANIFPYTSNANAVMTIDTFDGSETYKQQLGFNGVGDIYSRYGNNSWSKLYHSGNLTNYLSTNYIPKWNGSSMVNSLISDDGSNVRILGGTQIDANQIGIPYNNTFYINNYSSGNGNVSIGKQSGGVITIPSTTPSTSPTTGALVVGGGIGVGGAVYASSFSSNGAMVGNNIYGNTITSFGTFIGQSLSINTTSGVTNGSTSGTVIFNQPFVGVYYKKMVITLDNLVGTASKTFPVAWTYTPVILTTSGLPSSTITSISTTGLTVTAASATSGILIIEGY